MTKNDLACTLIDQMCKRGRKTISINDLHFLLGRVGIANQYRRKEAIEWLLLINKIEARKDNDKLYDIFEKDDRIR